MSENEQILAAFKEFKDDIKADLKEIKEGYVRVEVFQRLVDDVKEIRSGLARVVWLVLAAFIGALVSIVLHPEILSSVTTK